MAERIRRNQDDLDDDEVISENDGGVVEIPEDAPDEDEFLDDDEDD